MQWLALDIGGANIKVADGRDFGRTRPFPLWKDPSKLTSVLREVIAQSPASDHLAFSMTGELADCFATKSEGVSHILQAVEEASDGRHTRVYTTDGRWLSLPAARRVPLDCAAANWHALARFAGRYLADEDAGVLIDIGTTTTDVIPIGKEGPRTPARTDLERLRRGELRYSGVVRSPVCGVARQAPYREQQLPVALELFATMRDVYTILGDLPEDPGDVDTADARPATKVDSRRRLGRMLCADESQFHHRDAVVLAQAVRRSQVASIAESCRRVAQSADCVPTCVVACGCGEFLVDRVMRVLRWRGGEGAGDFLAGAPADPPGGTSDGVPLRFISLGRELGPRVSVAATAHALAVLADGQRGADL